MSPRAGSRDFALGRWEKAQQFADAASLFLEDDLSGSDLGDAYVTLAVHCGIAAAAVICVLALGQYSSGSAHQDAVALLRKVDVASSVQLSRLLGLKTKAGYAHRPVSDADIKVAARAHELLLEQARLRLT